MDTRPADYIRHRIQRFSDAIEETREHYSELSAFGRYPPSSPYYERSGILVLLDSMKADPGFSGELLQEFQEIDAKLKTLEHERGEEYRHRLQDELSACADRYCSAVCHANTGSLKFGTDHELFGRDRIYVLIHELEKDHDLSGIKDLICMLDRNLFYADGQREGEIPADSLQPTGKTRPFSEGDKIEG